MLWWFFELTSSIRFLRIHSGESFFKSKRIYEVVLPGLATALVLVVLVHYPTWFVTGFVKTVAEHTFQFMVFVVPFHLAALGAFATFQRPVLDEPLKGGSAELRVWSNGDQQYQWLQLSLRQYASLLFGYLCTLGMVFIGVFIVFSVFNFAALSRDVREIVSLIGVVSITFFVAHYALLSIYAITFLFEKVNGIGRAN